MFMVAQQGMAVYREGKVLHSKYTSWKSGRACETAAGPQAAACAATAVPTGAGVQNHAKEEIRKVAKRDTSTSGASGGRNLRGNTAVMGLGMLAMGAGALVLL